MRIIRVDENRVVTTVKVVGEAYILSEGDIISELGEIGQTMVSSEKFIDPTPSQLSPEPTTDDKINFLYYKAIGVI